MLKQSVFSLLFCLLFCGVANAQLLIEPTMVKSISDSIPIRTDRVELCKTLEGRESILASIDTISRKDIWYQWQGIKMNDPSFTKSFKEFQLDHVQASYCTAYPGGQEIYVMDTTRTTFVIKNRLWCSSANEGGSHKYDCNERIPITLPKGWQVCKLTYKKSHRRHGRHNFIPTYIKNDSQNPPRYDGFILHLTGHGDVGNVSRIDIWDIRITAIRSYEKNSVRRKCDCDMWEPVIPVAPKPTSPTTPSVTKTPAKLKWRIQNKRQNAADFVIENTGGSVGRLYYKISVLDGDDGQWDNYAEGSADLQPNTIFNQGLHKWRARDWRIDYAVIGEL